MQVGAGRCDPPRTGRYSGTPGMGRDDGTATDLTGTPFLEFISPLFPLQVHPCTGLDAIDTMQPNQQQRRICPFDSFFFPLLKLNHKRSPTLLNADWTLLHCAVLLPSSLSQLSTVTLHNRLNQVPSPSFGHLPEKRQLPVHNASCLHFPLPNIPAKSFTVSSVVAHSC